MTKRVFEKGELGGDQSPRGLTEIFGDEVWLTFGRGAPVTNFTGEYGSVLTLLIGDVA